MSYQSQSGGGLGNNFALIVVLFILLVIIGATFLGSGSSY